jgi:acetyl esterase/lipase
MTVKIDKAYKLHSERYGLALLLSFLFSSSLVADGGYLRTSAPLDEQRGYCLDVAGFGVNARPDEPLRSHTCKYGEDNVDQLFKWVDEESGHVVIPAYNRCLAAGSSQPGADLFVNECTDSELQAWTFVPNGNLSLRAYPKLCVTIGGERIDAGSDPLVFPGYGWRASTIETCRGRGDELQDIRWGREDEQRRGVANALRNGMSDDVAAGIIEISKNNKDVLARTRALYEGVSPTYRATEVKTTADIVYGKHQRHLLDVHVDTRRRGEELQPVVMFFHGGGFVRGNKDGNRNVAEYYSSIGLVGVTATYRLAPEANWPDGSNDVGAAINWVSDNISEYGGNPEQIYVIGKSAGAAHVATYALRPEVLDGEFPEVAGVILVSGSYTAKAESPTDSRKAYYGDDLGSWKDKEVLGNISRTSIPIMLTSSEFDLKGLGLSALQLVNEFASKNEDGTLPRIRQLPGHNHYSPNMSIGTTDRMLSNEILDFVLSGANQ